ncbi:MAG: ATP-dependent dethiobiotin synthetase BioD [Myxococcota bacterium]
MGAAGFFVTGSASAGGLTRAACALVGALRAENIDVGAMIPIETGAAGPGPRARDVLGRAAGGGDAPQDVCPCVLPLPASPRVAAGSAARNIDLDEIECAFDRIAAGRAAVVVQAWGGLLDPIDPGLCAADLAVRLGLPLVLAEVGSPGLLGRWALVCEAAAARSLEVAGGLVELPDRTGLSEAEATGLEAELEALRADLGPRFLGTLPADTAEVGPSEADLEVSSLLERLR